MSSAYMQNVGVKLFRKHMEQYTPPDPVYEYYSDPRGKQRRKKRDAPPGISPRDVVILKSVQRRARCLDKSFNLCGLRFGWTFILGLVPVAGDVACAALNYTLVVRKARQADLPSWLVARMLLNNAVSACGGFVPLVGSVVVAVYKANSRNAMLLEEYLRLRGEALLKEQAEKEAEESRAGGPRPASPPRESEQLLSAAASGSGRSWSSLVPSVGRMQAAVLTRGDRGRFIEHVNS